MKTMKQLCQRMREVYDSPAPRLVAEYSAGRFEVHTTDGVHKVFDTKPTEGGSEQTDEALEEGQEAQQEKADKKAVTDSALSMPARLAALNRLNTKKR